MKLFPKLLISLTSRKELVEDVIVALVDGLIGDSRLLEQVVLDNAPVDLIVRVEANLYKLAESGRVVVANGFSVAEGLENSVGLEDLMLHPGGLIWSY